jgi:hypothetical protein
MDGAGIVTWYEAANAATVGGIITKDGGGQDYSAYLHFVLSQTGLSADTVIDLNDDQQVLQFGRAMFRYEAGPALLWSNDQILFGIRCGREYANTKVWPSSPSLPAPHSASPRASSKRAMSNSDLFALLQKLLVALAGGTPSPQSATGVELQAVAPVQVPRARPSPVLSSIDKMFGGEALVGYKTMTGVLCDCDDPAGGRRARHRYTGRPTFSAHRCLRCAGGLSKIDRMTQSVVTFANAK